MFISNETLVGQSKVWETVLEDLAGGAGLNRARLVTGTTMIKAGTMVNVTGRAAEIVKTATVLAGGAANAPRINKNSQLKVGESYSDGVSVAAITGITVGTTYDTLALGANLVNYTSGVLFEVKTSATIGDFASATVEGASGHTLQIIDPSGQSVGLSVALTQAAGDTLAVSYASNILTISLANTTASKNTAVLIQAAIRTLVAPLYPLAQFVCVGTSWSEDGSTLTTAAATFAANVPDKFVPTHILRTDVDVENANPACACVLRGTLDESEIDYPITERYKSMLNLIKFN